MQGVTEAKRQSVLRKAVLLWIAGEEINMDTLLRLIYQEVTGSSDTTTIESLAEELSRMETGPQTISRDENEITYIHRLQKYYQTLPCRKQSSRGGPLNFGICIRKTLLKQSSCYKNSIYCPMPSG